MMYVSQEAVVIIKLASVDTTPLGVIAFDDTGLSVRTKLNDGALTAKALTATNWQSVTGEADTYLLAIDAAEVSETGIFTVVVAYTGADIFVHTEAIIEPDIIDTDALQYLRMHCQVNSDPVLTIDEQIYLLNSHRIVDTKGRLITDVNYEPTFDLASMVSDGWLMKAGKAAGNYAFVDAGLSLHRDQVHKQCLSQAEYWQSRLITSGQAMSANIEEVMI